MQHLAQLSPSCPPRATAVCQRVCKAEPQLIVVSVLQWEPPIQCFSVPPQGTMLTAPEYSSNCRVDKVWVAGLGPTHWVRASTAPTKLWLSHATSIAGLSDSPSACRSVLTLLSRKSAAVTFMLPDSDSVSQPVTRQQSSNEPTHHNHRANGWQPCCHRQAVTVHHDLLLYLPPSTATLANKHTVLGRERLFSRSQCLEGTRTNHIHPQLP